MARAYTVGDGVVTWVGTGTARVTVVPGQYLSVTIPMYVDSDYEADLTDISIHNEAELRRVAAGDFALDGTIRFYLERDIVLTQPWTPIGTSGTPFKAVFFGNGHTITINSFSPSAGYLGLFGATNGATIENLTIRYNNLTVNSSSTATRWMGGLAATATNTSINGVHVKGTIQYTAAGALYLGGLVGGAGGSSSRSEETSIFASSFTGTLVGTGAQDVSVGGILGVINSSSDDARIKESYAAGTIHADSSSAGNAFAGGIAGNGDCFIENCYSAAEVEASAATNAYAGGIIGQLPAADAITGLGKCYALGQVSADGSGIYAGGIAGRSGSNIDYCVALAKVDGTTSGDYVGRVIGDFWNGPPFPTNNYAASDKAIIRSTTYSSTAVDGDTTHTVAALQGPGNEGKYTALSWIFDTPGNGWKWIDGYGYPVLHWQDEAPDVNPDTLGSGFTWP
jgi:hypothetical protein